MELFLFFPFSLSSLYFWKKREYTCFRNQSSPGRYLDGTLSPAGICRTDPDSRDWTREHGYAKASAFPFPDLYLDDKVAQLTREDPAVLPLSPAVPAPICQPRIRPSVLLGPGGKLSQPGCAPEKHLDAGKLTPSPAWGEIRLEIFYDMGLFHLEDVPPRALALEQSRKEAAHTADLP
ncbi:MAG: hypothetical protein ACLT9P_04715 [Evtepia gabavorous]